MNTTHIPPDTTQTSPKQPPDISRELKMSTNDNMRQQTPPDILKQHLSVSEGVCWPLLSSVVVCCRLLISWAPWRCLGGIWGLSGGIWGVFMETGGTQTCLKGIWDSSPYNMEPLHYFGTALKRTTFFAWPYWGIKISKCLYIRFTKIIGLWDFFAFKCPSERNYKIQLYYITL